MINCCSKVNNCCLNYCSKRDFTSRWILQFRAKTSVPSVRSFLSLKWCCHLLIMNTNCLSNTSYCTYWVLKLLGLILFDLSVLKKKRKNKQSLSHWSLPLLYCEVTTLTLDGPVGKWSVTKLLSSINLTVYCTVLP